VIPPLKLSSRPTREFWEIPVLFEDEHLLALDKPPLLLTSPDRSDPHRPSLMVLLHQGIQHGSPWAKARGLSYVMNSHRLDCETSGVLLLAKTRPALLALANLFGSGQVHLTCLALVQGSPSEDTMVVEAKLAFRQESQTPGPDQAKTGLVTDAALARVDKKRGKRSKTAFQVRERFTDYTLLECRPMTHRRHQIRAHLQHMGFPMAGDRAYGGAPLFLSHLKSAYRLKPNKTERPLIDYPALHAERLSFLHPFTQTEVSISAPCPKVLNVALKYLRRYNFSSTGEP